jgi:lipopolysaccharide transport system ATP-binding protein
LSERIAIRLDRVTKDYPVTRVAHAGIKDFLVHLPQRVRELGRRQLFRSLHDVSFEVASGEFFGLIGRNGSGKSTTLGLVAGVIRPTAGEIDTNGHICPLLELGAGFHRDLTGRDNIVLNGVVLGMTRSRVAEQMGSIIEFSGLGDFIDQPVRSYSTGMVARLGFSVAMHLEPDILLVDEVLAVGDRDFRKKCLKRIEQFRGLGRTMMLVSHDMETVKKTCDRVGILDKGRLVFIGPTREAVAEYAKLLKA